ncbi:MAG TPA: methyltransferase domain-containing protein [Anaerolineales bacterium]|nr:methyltransferase domain-containing protein [Anaerolineales bacterium]
MHTHSHTHESAAQTEGRLVSWASFYDGLINLMTLGQIGHLRQMTVDRALLRVGDTVLDVGCGTGAVTIPAKKKVGNNGVVIGIDPDPAMIGIARQKAHRENVEIDFRVGVIESLSFPDATFDAVTSSLMVHHLPGHLRSKGLAEIFRVLKPGGRLLIAEMRRPTGSAFKKFFTSVILHHGHVVEFGLQDLPELLKAAGYEDVEQLDDSFLTIGFVQAKKPSV